MIALKNVSKCLNDFTIPPFSYTFDNCLYQLNGENGSGKSVLLKIVAGLDKKIGGTITNDLASRPILFLTNAGIGVPYLKIEDNILLSAKILGVKLKKTDFKSLYSKESYLDTLYNQSSLGNQNKVGLALLFSENDYGLIILDESLNGLDQKSTENILQRLRTLSLKRMCPIIFVSHVITLEDAIQVDIHHIVGGFEHE